MAADGGTPRIVLDTNVLVSGVLSASGPPGWIVEATLAGVVDLAVDDRICEEYRAVLTRPEFRLPVEHVEILLDAIDALALHVAAAPPCPIPPPDVDDEAFLAVAAATGSVLVTGNRRHFPVRCRGGVDVLSPREFMDRVRRGQ